VGLPPVRPRATRLRAPPVVRGLRRRRREFQPRRGAHPPIRGSAGNVWRGSQFRRSGRSCSSP
jgi:hypothetical protein